MTEREYRALKRNSYSTIKDFLKSRRKYYKKYVLNESTEEEDDDSAAIVFGSLVDCLLFSPEDKDNRFVLASYKMPTGQMLDFCKALWKRTKEATAEDGRVTREFLSIAREAYNDVAFDLNGNQVAFKQRGMTLEKVLERFDTEGKDYYEHLRYHSDKYVIEVGTEIVAESAIRDLKSNPITRDIINAKTEGDTEVLDQLVILWDYKDFEMKSMLDRVIINHEAKTIKPFDLKSGWNVEGFHYNYLKLFYYIQIACYNAALLNWVMKNGLEDYEISPMSFIAVDSTTTNSPLVYETTTEHLYDAINGFEVNGRKYTGFKKAMEDLKWHFESGMWGISKENFEKKGKLILNYRQ